MVDKNQLAAQIGIFNRLVQSFNKDITAVSTNSTSEPSKPKASPSKSTETVKKEVKKEEEKITPRPKEQEGSVLDKWGDLRMSPHFLKVADYFGVDWREFPVAEKKLRTIIQWAEEKTQSSDAMDMIRHIAKTSKKLPSAGMSEKPYAILYRYIKFGV